MPTDNAGGQLDLKAKTDAGETSKSPADDLGSWTPIGCAALKIVERLQKSRRELKS
jgi:hypothetical protein